MSFDVRMARYFGFRGLQARAEHAAEDTYRASDGLQGERNSECVEVKNHDGSFYENIGVDF